MSKGFSNYRKSVMGGGGGMPNMQQLMEQAQKMQEDLAAAKEQIAEAEFEGSSGGGSVKVTMTGDKKLTAVKISPDVVDVDDLEMLEDLIIAAANDADRKAEEYIKETMPEGANGLI